MTRDDPGQTTVTVIVRAYWIQRFRSLARRHCGHSLATTFRRYSVRRCSRRLSCVPRRAGWRGSPRGRCGHAHGHYAGCQDVGSRCCARRCKDSTILVPIRSNRWSSEQRARRTGPADPAELPTIGQRLTSLRGSGADTFGHTCL